MYAALRYAPVATLLFVAACNSTAETYPVGLARLRAAGAAEVGVPLTSTRIEELEPRILGRRRPAAPCRSPGLPEVEVGF